MYDRIEKTGSSQIQHGKYNDRIYLMHYAAEDGPELLQRLDTLAEQESYSKIFAKVPGDTAALFLQHGDRCEAEVPGFFRGRQAAAFMCKYFDQTRAVDEQADEIEANLAAARKRAPATQVSAPQLPEGFSLRQAVTDDAKAISALYRQVFETYPFPVHDPDYIRQTMESHVIYYCVHSQGELAAVSSAEMAKEDAVVEMTDFATLPVCRGKGIARVLLAHMEARMPELGIKTAYTIARAMSMPMNAVFAARGFVFGGTLIKNTQICGQLESMNVWYRHLG